MAIAYLNGNWSSPEDAKVSVLDRGFMFGDGIYEVISVYNAKPFALEDHLARLQRSLNELRLDSPVTDSEWKALITEGISRNESSFALVYIQITRGAAESRSHLFPSVAKPTILLMVTPAPHLKERNIQPLSAVTMQDFRWGKGHIKTVSLLANGLLKNEAIAMGVDDAILVRDGFVTESTASNVFMVKDGVILTPPKSNYLLHGITRDQVVSLAEETQMAIKEVQVSHDALSHADEIWITNTSQEVWPVGQLDGCLVGYGKPGPVFRQMDQHFQNLKQRLCGD